MRAPKKARKVECSACGTILTTVNGEWLRHVRRKAGLSLKRMSAKSGIPKTTLHNVETNAFRPSVEVLGQYGKLGAR